MPVAVRFLQSLVRFQFSACSHRLKKNSSFLLFPRDLPIVISWRRFGLLQYFVRRQSDQLSICLFLQFCTRRFFFWKFYLVVRRMIYLIFMIDSGLLHSREGGTRKPDMLLPPDYVLAYINLTPMDSVCLAEGWKIEFFEGKKRIIIETKDS